MSGTEGSTGQPETDTETGEPETETDAETEGDTDGETEGDTDEDVVETCVGSVVDHAQECGEGCPIVTDVRVTCEASAFGDPGLRVAPAPDATWLVTTSDFTAWMMEIQSDGLAAANELPEDVTRTTMSLALDPEGTPHVSADATVPGPGFAGGVVFFPASGPEYQPELVFDGEVMAPLFDMEFDLEGRAHMWFSSDPPDGRAEAIRALDGSWTQVDAPVPGDTGWQRYTVTPDGTSVAFDFVLDNGQYRLGALAGGTTQSIGTTYGSEYPGAYVHIAPPPMPALEVAGPDFVLIKEHGDGYRVAWPTADGSEEVLLDGTTALGFTCEIEGNGEPGLCPATCEEQGTGVDDRMAAVARTSDGRVWVAWMWTQLDQTLSYEETCDEEVGCYCNATIERDDSRGELVLAELDLETLELREVMRLSDTNPDVRSLFVDYRESPRGLDMRTFATDLALGARIRNADAFAPYAIRVLRIDTTLVPAG